MSPVSGMFSQSVITRVMLLIPLSVIQITPNTGYPSTSNSCMQLPNEHLKVKSLRIPQLSYGINIVKCTHKNIIISWVTSNINMQLLNVNLKVSISVFFGFLRHCQGECRHDA